MQKERRAHSGVCADDMGPYCKGAAASKKGKVPMPRSSSPVELFDDRVPSIVERAFATIAWDDLEECASAMRQESDSLGSRINESDGDDQDFEGYALDAMADSPGTLESSLSPAGLVSFEGCIIPPLTPPPDFSPENSFTSQSPEAGTPRAQNGAFWEGVVQHQEMVLDDAMEVNNQLQETLHQKQEEINSLQERNHNLRELSCRAKHLATVLDKLMTVRDLHAPDPALPPCDKASLPSSSPRKRRRLSEEDETGTLAPGSVEDILRDISTRCNAVLRGGAKGAGGRQDSESVRMFGAFSGLRTSISEGGGARLDGAEADGSHSSFRTSIKEHCTIRTQVFPHGHAFTSRAQHGGYRFRWVPNHS